MKDISENLTLEQGRLVTLNPLYWCLEDCENTKWKTAGPKRCYTKNLRQQSREINDIKSQVWKMPIVKNYGVDKNLKFNTNWPLQKTLLQVLSMPF